MILWRMVTGLSLLELRWRSRRQSLKSQTPHHHPGVQVTLVLRLVEDMEILMVDMVVVVVSDLMVVVTVVVLIEQVELMEVELVLTVDMVEANLVLMADMVVVDGYGGFREDPPLGYSTRYGSGLGRDYDLGGEYGVPDDSYGGYEDGGYRGGFGGGYRGGRGGSLYENRGGYGGGGGGRYHPYGR